MDVLTQYCRVCGKPVVVRYSAWHPYVCEPCSLSRALREGGDQREL